MYVPRLLYLCHLAFSSFDKLTILPDLLGGHTNTERGYLPVLATKLQEELKHDESLESGVEVAVSQSDQHPLQVV